MTFSRPPVRAVDKAEELNHKAQITWQRHTKTEKTNRNNYKQMKEVWTKFLKDRNTFEHPFETKWTDVEDDCRSLNKWKGRVFRGLELPTCSAKVPSERKLSCACEVLSSMSSRFSHSWQQFRNLRFQGLTRKRTLQPEIYCTGLGRDSLE